MPSGLHEQYNALWQAGNEAPDVFGFLDEHNGAQPNELVEVILVDQQHRWKTEKPLKVEEYLARLPDLNSDDDLKLQLAVGEFRARSDGDTSPDIDEFTSRFEGIRDTLRSKLTDLVSGQSPNRDEIEPATRTVSFEYSDGQGRLGRYRLIRVLGEGAFGRVYLALDDDLHRQVAIKVPKAERFQKPEDAEAYLTEARTVAGLDHPNIVPVYDMGRTDDGSVFVVSKYIEGRTLAEQIKQDRPAFDAAAALLATIARAPQHAHDRRLIHRDIKPDNILIGGRTGTPYVADFGLAIREEDYLAVGGIAGTPAYMSPEQARGEGHRLDGRSDVFSLGLVFYELLTGRRAFRGSSVEELLHQVVSVDPPAPRQIDDAIPAELERICLKAICKRTSDRYASADALANDLALWDRSEQPSRKQLQIVPRGLRSFGPDDADFFLDLLPGTRTRSGLPESIDFWKTRIEETDPDKTFSVGLIFGPSGCGKSSLMKAGLLPRLSKDVVAVYIEATPDETESRILRGLRKQWPQLPSEAGIVEVFTLLRCTQAAKVVVVLDQFEQWLHAHRGEQDAPLVNALRQCDGGRLQAIVMVRDDFAMLAARLMDDVDVPILQGHNFKTVDLFEQPHAEQVLTRFGQAFGKLPAPPNDLSEAERKFVADAVSGLAQDGKVVSVRLALFAEMVKEKPWVPETLQSVGGTEGIGVNFLEETFASRSANPQTSPARNGRTARPRRSAARGRQRHQGTHALARGTAGSFRLRAPCERLQRSAADSGRRIAADHADGERGGWRVEGGGRRRQASRGSGQ